MKYEIIYNPDSQTWQVYTVGGHLFMGEFTKEEDAIEYVEPFNKIW